MTGDVSSATQRVSPAIKMPLEGKQSTKSSLCSGLQQQPWYQISTKAALDKFKGTEGVTRGMQT